MTLKKLFTLFPLSVPRTPPALRSLSLPVTRGQRRLRELILKAQHPENPPFFFLTQCESAGMAKWIRASPPKPHVVKRPQRDAVGNSFHSRKLWEHSSSLILWLCSLYGYTRASKMLFSLAFSLHVHILAVLMRCMWVCWLGIGHVLFNSKRQVASLWKEPLVVMLLPDQQLLVDKRKDGSIWL